MFVRTFKKDKKLPLQKKYIYDYSLHVKSFNQVGEAKLTETCTLVNETSARYFGPYNLQ